MKHINHSVVVVGAALLLLCASCRKETIKLNMTATLEQPTLDVDSTDGKNYLTNAEQWIYWEAGDAIHLSGDNPDAFTLTNGAGSRLGYFAGNVTVEKDGDVLSAVYPATSYVDATHLTYPATMPYRAVASAQDPDRSFGQNCFPMVAQFTVKSTGSDIDFHSVSGMVRLHLYSSQTTEKTISSIKFTSVERTGYTRHQLSGKFEIRDIDKNAPYLASAYATETGEPYFSTTITGISKSVGGSGKGNFLTFYLPLPAYFSGTTGGSSASANQTKYALQMTVTATDGSTFVKTFGADIRRNCITKMQALDITTWTAATSTAVVGLVGCGTQDRPFQIYTLDELLKVRNAFNNAAAAGTTPTVNGITVTANTYFKVSRTDIVMNATDWDAGIKNFKGHFICSTSSPTGFGITNNSQHPLFESISADGTVEYVSVKGTVNYNRSTTEAFSPFCITNNGKIDNCHVLCTVSSTANVAGLCVTNNGTISASALESSLTASTTGAHVGGLVLTNNGTMQGFNISTVQLIGSACGGMCYENNGLIENCIVSTNANAISSSNIGMIVYVNNAVATVKDCYVTGIFTTTGSVGAVAYNNKGRIDDCRTDLSVTTAVAAAGITVYQQGTAAEIRNCRTFRTATTMSATAASAGIVCYLQGGKIANSYNRASMTRPNNNAVTGGIVAVLGATGTTTDAITIQNVYNSMSGFFGTTASETINEVTTNNVQSGATTVTLTNCYNYASQDLLTNGTGVTRTVNKVSSLSSGTTLADALNGWASCDGTTYFRWTGNPYPTLVDPSNPVTKSRGAAYANHGSVARHGSAAARVAAARSHRR